jgi:hypothetical protein
VIFLFLTASALVQGIRTQKPLQFVFAGILSGVTALFLQYEGAVSILAGIVLLLIDGAATRRVRNVALFCCGATALPLMVLGYFATQGATFDFLYSTILFPLSQYRGSNGANPSSLGLWQGALLLCVLFVLRKTVWHTPARVLAVFAVFLGLANLSSGNAANVLLNSFFVHLFVLWWLYQLGMTRDIRWSICGYALPVLLLSWIYGQRAITPWYKKIDWISAATASVQTPAGEIRVAPEMQEKMVLVFEWLKANPHRNVFFGPYAAYYYLLTGRMNPTGYSQLTSNYNTPEQFAQALAQIESQKVDAIIFLPYESVFRVDNDHPVVQLLEREFQMIDLLPLAGWTNYRGYLPELEGIWVKGHDFSQAP